MVDRVEENVSNLYVYTPPGSAVSLAKENPIASASVQAQRDLLASVAALRPLVVPLAFELSVAAFPDDFPISADALRPPIALWQWAIEPWPPHVEPPLEVDPAHASAVVAPELPALESCLERSLKQHAPDGYTLTIDTYSALRTRTCLGTGLCGGDTSVVVELHGEQVGVPVERMDGQLWVAGPLRETSTYPPVAVEFANLGTFVQLRLNLGWSLFCPQTAFHSMLVAALRRLVELGWSVETARGVAGLPTDLCGT